MEFRPAGWTSDDRVLLIMFQRIKHVHFVGIGGSGMSGIAEVLLTLGYKVTGSDKKMTRVTDNLREAGAGIYESHAARNVHGAHVVVRSSAVASDNPELLEAEARKIPVISRAEMLAELARLKYTIAVAGTHGKTTTTSMIATILDHAGMDPTFVVGGRLKTLGRNARLGKGEFIVLEADESDRSFLMLSPTIAVVTNVEADHLDNFSGLEDIQSAFRAFVGKVPFYGSIILPAGNGTVAPIASRVKRRIVTFGTDAGADVEISECVLDGLSSRFVLRYEGDRYQECELRVPGRHNVLNAAAAFAAALEMGVEADSCAGALAKFEGVERRFEIKSREPLVVIDDYAHHPTEVRATLAAARAAGFKRVLAAFQPHRYTRTYHFFEEFARAFDEADMLFVTEIYSAGEAPIDGVTAESLVERIRAVSPVSAHHCRDLEEIRTNLRRHARPGDAVLVMGAGSITAVADLLAEAESLEVSHD
jgi:UDP-N-acetylmuramate--alanine ligase